MSDCSKLLLLWAGGAQKALLYSPHLHPIAVAATAVVTMLHWSQAQGLAPWTLCWTVGLPSCQPLQ
jgi:hypothetical protein